MQRSDVIQNELDPCCSELLILSYKFALSCQRIHNFALRNLPFRLESKSFTDALGSRSHKIMHTGKTFSAISPKRRQVVKGCNTGLFCSSEPVDRAVEKTQNPSGKAETGCILLGNTNLCPFTHSRLNCIRH